MDDPTENIRRHLINTGHPESAATRAKRTYTTSEFTEEFEAISFLAPFVICRRRSDGVVGSMEFTHSPRAYFNFVPDKVS